MINIEHHVKRIPVLLDFIEVAEAFGVSLAYSTDGQRVLLQERDHGFKYTFAQFDDVDALRSYMQGFIDVVRLANKAEQ